MKTDSKNHTKKFKIKNLIILFVALNFVACSSASSNSSSSNSASSNSASSNSASSNSSSSSNNIKPNPPTSNRKNDIKISDEQGITVDNNAKYIFFYGNDNYTLLAGDTKNKIAIASGSVKMSKDTDKNISIFNLSKESNYVDYIDNGDKLTISDGVTINFENPNSTGTDRGIVNRKDLTIGNNVKLKGENLWSIFNYNGNVTFGENVSIEGNLKINGGTLIFNAPIKLNKIEINKRPTIILDVKALEETTKDGKKIDGLVGLYIEETDIEKTKEFSTSADVKFKNLKSLDNITSNTKDKEKHLKFANTDENFKFNAVEESNSNSIYLSSAKVKFKTENNRRIWTITNE